MINLEFFNTTFNIQILMTNIEIFKRFTQVIHWRLTWFDSKSFAIPQFQLDDLSFCRVLYQEVMESFLRSGKMKVEKSDLPIWHNCKTYVTLIIDSKISNPRNFFNHLLFYSYHHQNWKSNGFPSLKLLTTHSMCQVQSVVYAFSPPLHRTTFLLKLPFVSVWHNMKAGWVGVSLDQQ